MPERFAAIAKIAGVAKPISSDFGGHADLLGLRARERAASRFWRARPAASCSWMSGLCLHLL
eukprot:13611402-Alexandrium_andersonii.AAC.1